MISITIFHNICVLFGFYTAKNSSFSPTFRDNQSALYSRAKLSILLRNSKYFSPNTAEFRKRLSLYKSHQAWPAFLSAQKWVRNWNYTNTGKPINLVRSLCTATLCVTGLTRTSPGYTRGLCGEWPATIRLMLAQINWKRWLKRKFGSYVAKIYRICVANLIHLNFDGNCGCFFGKPN